MIMADKIIRLRKKNGWAQEELAEKVGVSRQAVSKWESAQTVPDLDKILRLGQLFGVTTDYLLKDEQEDEELTGEDVDSGFKHVSLADANSYLAVSKSSALMTAISTVLFVLSLIPLLLLDGAQEAGMIALSGDMAEGIGLIIMMLVVVFATLLLVYNGSRKGSWKHIDKGEFEAEYGVSGLVKERQNAYKSSYERRKLAGIGLCCLSVIPLFVAGFMPEGFAAYAPVCCALLMAGAGGAVILNGALRWADMKKLLREGEYALAKKQQNRILSAVTTAFWLLIVAAFLCWNFIFGGWDISWVLFPVGGVVYGIIYALCSVLIKEEK